MSNVGPTARDRNATCGADIGRRRGIVGQDAQENFLNAYTHTQAETKKENFNDEESVTDRNAEEKIFADANTVTFPDFVAASKKEIAVTNSEAAAV